MELTVLEYLSNQVIGAGSIIMPPSSRWLRSKFSCLAAEPSTIRRVHFTIRLPITGDELKTYSLVIELTGINFLPTDHYDSPRPFVAYGLAADRQVEIHCCNGEVHSIRLAGLQA